MAAMSNFLKIAGKDKVMIIYRVNMICVVLSNFQGHPLTQG